MLAMSIRRRGQPNTNLWMTPKLHLEKPEAAVSLPMALSGTGGAESNEEANDLGEINQHGT
jgi:hypothetical protein